MFRAEELVVSRLLRCSLLTECRIAVEACFSTHVSPAMGHAFDPQEHAACAAQISRTQAGGSGGGRGETQLSQQLAAPSVCPAFWDAKLRGLGECRLHAGSRKVGTKPT